MSSLKKAGKMPASAFTSPDCAGFLRKEGGRFKTWKKRYFILANNYLYYYTSPTDDDCKGIVSLEDCKVYEHESTDGRKTVVGKAAKDSVQKRTNVFEVYHPIRRAYTLQVCRPLPSPGSPSHRLRLPAALLLRIRPRRCRQTGAVARAQPAGAPSPSNRQRLLFPSRRQPPPDCPLAHRPTLLRR